MLSKRLLAFLAISLSAAIAYAQSVPGPALSPDETILGTSSPDLLLMRGDVRDDLQLSADQSIKIFTIQDSVQEETEKISTATTEESEGPDTSYDAIRKYAIEQVDQVLTPDQMKRLKQISLQLTGYSALARADVQKEIDLSKDLQIKIYDLANEERLANESVTQKYQNGDLTPAQFPEIIKKNHLILNAEIAKILPQGVKDKFKSLEGKPFKSSPTI